jgi:hypothetical protein
MTPTAPLLIAALNWKEPHVVEVALGHYNPVTIFGRRSLSMFLVFEYRKYLLGGLSRRRAQTG